MAILMVSVMRAQFLGANLMLLDGPKFMLLALLLIAVVGYLVLRLLVFQLADEVILSGETIIVRKGRRKATIPLHDVVNLELSELMNPERITLTLGQPCELGAEITFIPPIRVVQFTPHPVATELRQRLVSSGKVQ